MKQICIFLLFVFGKISGETGLVISGEKREVEDECSKFCGRTYPPHTIEKPDASNACKQGCRLFTITQLTKGFEEAKKSCDSGCGEGYGKDSQKLHACKTGCKNQMESGSKIQGNFMISVDSSDPMFDFYSKNLFGNFWKKMQNFHENMMKNFKQFRNWMNFDDFDKNFEEMEKNFDEIFEDSKNGKKFGKNFEETKKSFENEEKSVGNLNSNGDPILKVQILDPFEDSTSVMNIEGNTFKIDQEKPEEPAPPINRNRYVDPGDNFLAVLANRSKNLTFWGRWLLFFALMLCIIAMIYICLAVIRTAPRHYIYSRKLSIYGDYDEKFALPDEADAPPPYEEENGAGGALLVFFAEEEKNEDEKNFCESRNEIPQIHKK